MTSISLGRDTSSGLPVSRVYRLARLHFEEIDAGDQLFCGVVFFLGEIMALSATVGFRVKGNIMYGT